MRTIVPWSGPAPVPANKLPPHRLGLRDGIFAIDAEGTGEEIVCDVPHPEAAGLLAAKGMLPRRNLKRMVMPFRPDCLCSGMVWCAAGFELG